MHRTVPMLLALAACSDFSSDERVIRVPDARADLTDHADFRSQLVDMDGDSLVDLVTYRAGASSIGVSRGLPDGGFDSEETWDLPDDVRFIRDDFAWRTLGDMNGDGRADILAAEPWNDELAFTMYLGRDGSFDAGADWGQLPADGELGDIDGDRVADWVRRGNSENADYTSFGGAGNFHWKVFLGGATNFADTATEWPTRGRYALPVGDWDGDGIGDAIVWDGSSDDPYGSYELTEGGYAIDLHTGTTSGFRAQALAWGAPSDFSAEVGTRYRPLDVTCDGQVDLVRRVAREGEWIGGLAFFPNRGDSFGSDTRLSFPQPATYEGTIRPVLVDVTGDGCRDLIYTTTDGEQTFGGESDPQWLVFEG